MKTITGKHKCGCVWTRIYPKGATKHEISAEENRRENSLCAKCERILVDLVDCLEVSEW